MSRREAWLSAVAVFAFAVLIRIWAASVITFPRPEDTAYYVGVARNVVDGHGLVSNAIWSYQTPPLSFPRPAFEVWLPLPSFLAAIPMALLGTTFAAAQWSSILVGGLVAVLAWRLAADVAAERGLPPGRARSLALGAGLTAAVYLPLVLASALPDSTTPFAALVLAACLLMNRLITLAASRNGTVLFRMPMRGISGGLGAAATAMYAPDGHSEQHPSRSAVLLALLGVVIGLAALTRNEAIWLGLVWAWLAWRQARTARARATLIVIPAVVALLVFSPWAIRDWIAFGSPLPGQALANALSLHGSDIFAWGDPPTIARYLAAGPATLLGLRVTGLGHNLGSVLLLLGMPISAIGLVALPWTAGGRVLRPLVLFSIVTFVLTTLLFPVSSTWGTFQHAAGAIEVLLVISAVLALDAVIERVGRIRGWTRPVAWLGPALTISAGLLFCLVILPSEGQSGRHTATQFAAIPTELAAAGVPLEHEGPVITDTPIWFAEETGHQALALPDESPVDVLDLANQFGATLLVVRADNGGIWPEVASSGATGASCFVPVTQPEVPGVSPERAEVFRIACP
jgi:hypothetical protein